MPTRRKCDLPECELGHCPLPEKGTICPVYKNTVRTSLAAGRVLWDNLSATDKIMLWFMIDTHRSYKRENDDIFWTFQ